MRRPFSSEMAAVCGILSEFAAPPVLLTGIVTVDGSEGCCFCEKPGMQMAIKLIDNIVSSEIAPAIAASLPNIGSNDADFCMLVLVNRA